MNNFIKTDAFCLKIQPVRNNSAVLFFFTKELGVISLFQKGFFARKNALSGIIDIGLEVALLLKQSQKGLFLQEADLISSYNALDYHSLTLSSFIFELLGSLPQRMELNSQYLYLLLQTILSKISSSSGKFNLILNFEVKLLFELGLTGDPEVCSNCHQSFMPNMKSFSVWGELNFLCYNCCNNSLKYNCFLANERQMIASWLHNNDLYFASHLGKNSVLKLQRHLNTIFNEMCVLKTLDPLMEIMYNEAVAK